MARKNIFTFRMADEEICALKAIKVHFQDPDISSALRRLVWLEGLNQDVFTPGDIEWLQTMDNIKEDSNAIQR